MNSQNNYSNKYLKIFVNIIFLIIMVLIIFFIVPRALIFFMPFLIGWIISIIANPLVKFLETKVNIVRKLSSAIIIISVLTLIIFSIYFAFSKIYSESVEFVSNLPQIYENLESDILKVQQNLIRFYEILPPPLKDNLILVTENLSEYIGEFIQNMGIPTVVAAGNIAKNLPSTLLNIIITILAAYFFIVDRDRLNSFINDITPNYILHRYYFISKNLKVVLGGYFKAQFQLMIIVVFIVLIGFLVLRVNYIFILTILIAVLDFLPLFGSGIILIPWALFKALTSDYFTAFGLLIIYTTVQVTRQVIQPKLIGDSIGLDPLVTLVLMYTGFKFRGFLGMLIAIPLGLILFNLYREGVFDKAISVTKEMIEDINNYRRL
ncbi:sporulation integral membrane protein YtvI [Acetoanaerobium pronyense]|uniref:Sporulation integral membrane protein YtvI n=1 Tax=Acetoanaerobium pronyense TaxID=1482736 RepID=A0ABS4KGD9_9FIRM|nr:sporulation integral membrane protein YtvI [Acetoanaerobium pronyense]MBP2026813.1 sporulation integral membrane protein YtvI [Acetoanaerobium pronyense]